MLPWTSRSAARRLASATRAAAAAAAAASASAAARSPAPATRREDCPLLLDDREEEPWQHRAVREDVFWPNGRRLPTQHPRHRGRASHPILLPPPRRTARASVSPSHRRRPLLPPPRLPRKSLGRRRASAPPPLLKCPRPQRPLAPPLRHRPHHMAPALLRPASPRLPAPCAADSGRSRGTVSIADSRARGVALRAGGSGRTKASRDHSGLTRQLLDFQHDTVNEADGDYDPFGQLKARFMDFKQRNYVENYTKYKSLAEQQTPEFIVVACADSRVCPTSILGLQPGDAFTVRNIANLVPPYEHGASETTAALEFAVNTLKVPNVLVVGHSRCGGIQALMSMKNKKDDSSSRSFIRDWVSLGKSARLSTEAAAGNLNFESQCRHCEKESINSSLLNLLTYPWIEERVREGTLNLHAGYYNFVDCTFEKWTLVYRPGLEGGSKYAIKNRSTWS